jgi:signal transduction histidine kinase
METFKNSAFKILVVDDDQDLLLISERLLKKDNYNVSTAKDGQECFNAIRTDKPDLLLLDVDLPDTNGIEICKKIKNDPELSTIFIIMLSGFKIDSENISEGLETGADGYLIKPIKNRELLARVEAAKRIIHAEKALRESEERLKQFTIHLLNIHEEEKILLATQLDNELSQILVALKMDIGMLKKKVLSENINTETEELFLKLDHAYNMVSNSISTSMKFMSVLRNEALYLVGFVEAVKLYTSDFQTKYNIVSEFESNIVDFNTDQQKSTSLFRIFQNAMSNVAQHSKATKVRINLYKLEEKLVLEIWDNGIGFDTEKLSNPDSTGLIFMKERALLLNGELQVESLQDQGTNIRVEIPYPN